MSSRISDFLSNFSQYVLGDPYEEPPTKPFRTYEELCGEVQSILVPEPIKAGFGASVLHTMSKSFALEHR